MAIGTATAIGLGVTAIGTGYSFAQAASQKKEQAKAENEAAKFLADARKKLEVNFYDQLAIQKEPYQLAREAVTSTAAQAIEAGKESERGAAATAGRVLYSTEEEQRKIAAQMGQEMAGLQKLSAAEDARLRDMQANLDIKEVESAQKAAAVAEARAAQAMSQGMQGVKSLGEQVAATFPDYQKTAGVRRFEDLSSTAKDAGLSQQQFQQQLAAFGTMSPTFSNLAGVGAMNPTQFAAFMGGLSPEYLKQIQAAFNPTGIYTQPIVGQGLMGPQ